MKRVFFLFGIFIFISSCSSFNELCPAYSYVDFSEDEENSAEITKR